MIAAAAAWFGAGAASLLDRGGRRYVSALTQIGSGALLAVAVFDIFPEASAHLDWLPLTASAALGFALLWIIGAKVFPVCPSCSFSHFEKETADPDRKTILFLAAALGVHCLLDGLIIAVDRSAPAASQTGLLVGLAIHKVPEGFALGLLLYGAGLDRLNALATACGIEALTIVGGLASLLVLSQPPEGVISAIFAFVGGGFLYLVYNSWTSGEAHEKIPHLHRWIVYEAAAFCTVGLFLTLLSHFR